MKPGEFVKISFPWNAPDLRAYPVTSEEILTGENIWNFGLLLGIGDLSDSPKTNFTDSRELATYNNNIAMKSVMMERPLYESSSKVLTQSGKLMIFPLSVQSELTVSYDLPNGEYELRISGVQNRLNQKIYKLDSTKKDIRINVSHFSRGIYIATIIGKDGNTIKSVKFIKE